MSSIQRLFNRTITIRRKQTLNGYKKDFTTITASAPAHIQMENSESIIDQYGVDRAAFNGWVNKDLDIKKNDMVLDKYDGRIYIVVDVIDMGFGVASNEHKEIRFANYPK